MSFQMCKLNFLLLFLFYRVIWHFNIADSFQLLRNFSGSLIGNVEKTKLNHGFFSVVSSLILYTSVCDYTPIVFYTEVF